MRRSSAEGLGELVRGQPGPRVLAEPPPAEAQRARSADRGSKRPRRGEFARTRQRSMSSLLAHGEPLLWLTGGALAICCLMVSGLLLIVLMRGGGTFWPQPVERLETHDGRVYMGEITREERHRPEPGVVARLAPAAAARAGDELAANDGWLGRRLVRTGNFRLTQTHFAWVDDFDVARVTRPQWAVVLERLEWGRFYGIPQAFVLLHPLTGDDATRREGAASLARAIAGRGHRAAVLGEGVVDGRVQPILTPLAAVATPPAAVAEVISEPAAAWAAYERFREPVRERWEARRDLEEHDTGAVNQRQEEARLEVREAELELAEAVAGAGESSAAAVAARRELEAAEARYAEVLAWANEQFARIRQEIDRIDRENGRFQLLMRTAGEGTQPPQSTLVRLDDIVRAYPANRLGLGGSLRVYLSRWAEFLHAEPREANSEGGVFPAIFGTVAMTLIMAIVVVPFGILAALYLREYAKPGPLVSAVRIAVNNLAGVPSIVFGVFGLGFFCYLVGASLDELLFAAHLPNPTFGKGGLLWASLTLALLTLPVVIVATEEAVAAVPSSMREGSYACGASKWQTIQRIVLPRALPGIITGMILAIARGAGEVAPLMLVGAVKLAPELPIDGVFPYIHPERSFMHLGFHIYDVGFQSQNSEAAKPMVFTTTLLLIAIIASLNLLAIRLRTHLRTKYAAGQF